jgi:membrane-associated protein
MISSLEIFKLLYIYSYLILFPLVVIEGPVVTIIAGFLVSLGFMDFLPTYLVVVAGDLAGDVIYYSAGRWWFHNAVRKVASFFGFRVKLIQTLEEAVKKHKGKVLFFGKLSHALGGIILFAAGSAEIPLREFLWFNFLATLPKSLVLLAVGYYFGSTITNFKKYVDFTVVGLFVFTLILIGIYFAIVYFSNKVVKKLEK